MHKYIGQLDFIDKYIVYVEHYEEVYYYFINRMNGKAQLFETLPYVSPDKKYAISIVSNEMMNILCDLQLYEISNKELNHKLSINFKNWIPGNDSFWSTDNCLYMAVSDLGGYSHYIRIKVI